jgi:hypothetical protein
MGSSRVSVIDTVATAPVDRLRHARDWLRRGNHPDLAAVADGFDRYLDLQSNLTLDAALGLAPSQSAESWRTVGRRAERDTQLRALAERFMPGLSVSKRAGKVAAMISRYEPRWRRIDCHAEMLPSSYQGTPDQHLFCAFAAYDGKMPSKRSLRRILCRAGHELPPIDGQQRARQ